MSVCVWQRGNSQLRPNSQSNGWDGGMGDGDRTIYVRDITTTTPTIGVAVAKRVGGRNLREREGAGVNYSGRAKPTRRNGSAGQWL